MAVLEYVNLHPKLILFGEYTVLIGGQAFTIPLKEYSARLEFMDQALDIESATESNFQLKLFLNYIENNKQIADSIDVQGLALDINDGLYLFSNVPYGYGLGSSGLLCAIIFKTYSKQKKALSAEEIDMQGLKSLLALMESFFHKKSSGIDPLASYIGEPLLLVDNEIHIVTPPAFDDGKWFLIDSGITRNTEKYVTLFTENIKNHIYKQELEYNYLPFINEMISRILHSTSENLNDWASTRPTKTLMESISLLQMKYFAGMIPDTLLPLWQFGIDTGYFYLKLLGAGGGGYFLGFTNDYEQTRDIARSYRFKCKQLKI